MPHDAIPRLALVAGALLVGVSLMPGGPQWIASSFEFAGLADVRRRRRFVVLSSFLAAFLSLGYVALYLNGGPGAPDAATYWLQGRALTHGALSWPAPEPTASFRAEGLVLTPYGRLAGVFPPAFPLLLSMGFLVGAPMLVGPLVAAALVAVTWFLARELAAAADIRGARAEAMARTAAGLSIVSAALRYHTAEALPHGSAAAAIALAMACALRARRTDDVRLFALVGLTLGLLVAGRPTSSVVAGAIVLALVWGARERLRALLYLVLAGLPGLALLLVANHAATGSAFHSPVAAYLAGVTPVTPAGASHAVGSVLVTVLQRLRVHAMDVDNFEPLALLAGVALLPIGGKSPPRAAYVLALVVAGQMFVQAPLAPDSVSNAGASPLFARVLDEILPIEHVLMALGLARWRPRIQGAMATATLGVALLGFGVHASHVHAELAAIGLGRSHFDPDVVREANVTFGLIYFDDDRGYELAYGPAVLPSHGVQAVRQRGDDHDRLLYDLLGHPPSHRYSSTGARVTDGPEIVPWAPPAVAADNWRFEAESDWPPIGTTGGWAQVIDAGLSCASGSHALVLTPAGPGDATTTLELPAPRGATPAARRLWTVTPRAFQRGGAGTATLALLAEPGGPALAHWSWIDGTPSTACLNLPPESVELGGERTHVWLVLTAHGGPIALDSTTLRGR